MRLILLFSIGLSACGAVSGSIDAGFDAGQPASSPCDAGVLADGGCVVPPMAGAACSSAGFWCQDPAVALECKLNSWVSLPCRGDGGCVISSGTVTCDMTGNLEGDHCPSTAEGRGLCTADAKGTLECRDGILVKTNVCRSCTVSGGLVTCTP